MASFLRTPHGILLSFGCLLLGVAGFTAYDFCRRPELETIVMPSGAGDTDFFQPAAPLALFTELVRQEGRPFHLLKLDPLDASDARMFPAGRDDTGRITLYRRDPKSPEESAGQWRYLKVARHRYLRIAPNPPALP